MMDTKEMKQIVEQAIDQRFCCNANECEAAFCRVRLDRIEAQLNHIVDYLKREKRHD